MESGILLLYDYYPAANAATILEHVGAFSEYSRFPVIAVNTRFGFPDELRGRYFQVVVLHYSLFGTTKYMLNDEFVSYLAACDTSYKVAFFQDEHHYCRQRFAFLNRYAINCVYTLMEPQHLKDVYKKYTKVQKYVYTLTGYVSEALITAAGRFAKRDDRRTVDVGYRGRELALYMGRGSQEKTEIAREFERRAAGLGLRLDLKIRENERLYGKAWYRFLGNCRAVLGVEAGVSIFDIDDVVEPEYHRLVRENPDITREELGRRLLDRWEGNIPYRTISPRHFEAPAFRCCQILYEGYYSGILRPGRNYLALRKDWTNFDDVIRDFCDEPRRLRVVQDAYDDLIGSGRYTYAQFVRGFDEELMKEGIAPRAGSEEETRWRRAHARRARRIRTTLTLWIRARDMYYRTRYRPFPGRARLKAVVAPALNFLRRAVSTAE